MKLHLFQGYGVELEYMIVYRSSLDVFPITDRLLEQMAGCSTSDVELSQISLSNELALHVIEFKTTDPVSSLHGLAAQFQSGIREVNRQLEPFQAQLMPTAMHPWMHPDSEARLWPHECNEIYNAFDRLFGCQGHGWSNLQSVHLNLPFFDDEEFARLHAAVRVVLPLLPALAASSPIVELKSTGILDNRLEFYRTNSARIPLVTGTMIPEPVFSFHDYQEQILQKIYNELAPYDPEKILQHEWVNARGAIARFQRNTIEIRLLDVQECPKADLAILWALDRILHGLVEERWSTLTEQQAWSEDALQKILLSAIHDAEAAPLTDADYASLFGFSPPSSCRLRDLWIHLLQEFQAEQEEELSQPLRNLMERGTLARRILRRTGNDLSKEKIAGIYRELCDCLEKGELFLG